MDEGTIADLVFRPHLLKKNVELPGLAPGTNDPYYDFGTPDQKKKTEAAHRRLNGLKPIGSAGTIPEPKVPSHTPIAFTSA